MPHADPVRRATYQQEYQKMRAYFKERKRRARIEVLEKYGGSPPSCACCGETILEFLCIDHVNGNGRQHRRIMKASSIYAALKRDGYPEGFQVLCHNCNMAKGFYQTCPHSVNKEG